MPIIADGVNEQGLACGGFYLLGWAEYEAITSPDVSNVISNLDFVSWILGNFKTVNEVLQALKNITVAGVVLKEWNFIPP